jgi:Zn-dependent membrane protease YugP
MPYYYFYGYDPTYFFVLIVTLIISAYAQIKVKSTFKKYSSIGNVKMLSGAAAAQQVAQFGGAGNIGIQRIAGNLTDNFDPRTNVISLSESVFGSTSIAAVGVAAHEAGHAVQHATGYVPNKIRSVLVPVTRFGTMIAFPLIIVGAMMYNTSNLVLILGIALYSLSYIFQVATLPVEFNASHRAIQILDESGMLYPDELDGAKKVLQAAALTYMAAAFTSLLWLLRILWIFFGRRGND